MKKAKIDQVIEIVKTLGILRPRDLDAHAVPREYLIRLSGQGRLEKLGRGLYQIPQADMTENHSLAEASKKVPHGIICLLLVLPPSFHLKYGWLSTEKLEYQKWKD
jgi:predicted transcriptional regulator of viral defense system